MVSDCVLFETDCRSTWSYNYQIICVFTRMVQAWHMLLYLRAQVLYQLQDRSRNGWLFPYDVKYNPKSTRHYVFCFDPFNPTCSSRINFYHKFNLYKALERHGIVPGHKYKSEQFTKALVKEFGTVPNLQCDTGTGNLNAIWLYFHAKGPVRNLELRPTVPNAPNACNDTIVYPIKYPGEINGHYPELLHQF